MIHGLLEKLIPPNSQWFSVKNIGPGDRWRNEVSTALEECNFGIICVTQENVEAPWLLFEAGALAKSLDKGKVVPILVNLEIKRLKDPLAQFQAVSANKKGIKELVLKLNNELGIDVDLSKSFEACWRKFSNKIKILSEKEYPVSDDSYSNLTEVSKKLFKHKITLIDSDFSVDRNKLNEVVRATYNDIGLSEIIEKVIEDNFHLYINFAHNECYYSIPLKSPRDPNPDKDVAKAEVRPRLGKWILNSLDISTAAPLGIIFRYDKDSTSWEHQCDNSMLFSQGVNSPHSPLVYVFNIPLSASGLSDKAFRKSSLVRCIQGKTNDFEGFQTALINLLTALKSNTYMGIEIKESLHLPVFSTPKIGMVIQPIGGRKIPRDLPSLLLLRCCAEHFLGCLISKIKHLTQSGE